MSFNRRKYKKFVDEDDRKTEETKKDENINLDQTCLDLPLYIPQSSPKEIPKKETTNKNKNKDKYDNIFDNSPNQATERKFRNQARNFLFKAKGKKGDEQQEKPVTPLDQSKTRFKKT